MTHSAPNGESEYPQTYLRYSVSRMSQRPSRLIKVQRCLKVCEKPARSLIRTPSLYRSKGLPQLQDIEGITFRQRGALHPGSIRRWLREFSAALESPRGAGTL